MAQGIDVRIAEALPARERTDEEAERRSDARLVRTALAELPDTESESDVIARAARHGVAVDGLASYTAAGHERGPALVIGYGRPADHVFTRGTQAYARQKA